MANPQENVQGLAKGDVSMLDTLQHSIESSFEESGLDPQTFMRVNIAALATLDAAPASWLMNSAASGAAAGLEPEKFLGILMAIAPVIGTARSVSAVGNILKALALAEELAEEYHECWLCSCERERSVRSARFQQEGLSWEGYQEWRCTGMCMPHGRRYRYA